MVYIQRLINFAAFLRDYLTDSDTNFDFARNQERTNRPTYSPLLSRMPFHAKNKDENPCYF